MLENEYITSGARVWYQCCQQGHRFCLFSAPRRRQDRGLPHLFSHLHLLLPVFPCHSILSLLFTLHFIKWALRTYHFKTLFRHVEQIWNIKSYEDPAFKKVVLFGEIRHTYIGNLDITIIPHEPGFIDYIYTHPQTWSKKYKSVQIF